jgi:hypothetical protein
MPGPALTASVTRPEAAVSTARPAAPEHHPIGSSPGSGGARATRTVNARCSWLPPASRAQVASRRGARIPTSDVRCVAPSTRPPGRLGSPGAPRSRPHRGLDSQESERPSAKGSRAGAARNDDIGHFAFPISYMISILIMVRKTASQFLAVLVRAVGDDVREQFDQKSLSAYSNAMTTSIDRRLGDQHHTPKPDTP